MLFHKIGLHYIQPLSGKYSIFEVSYQALAYLNNKLIIRIYAVNIFTICI